MKRRLATRLSLTSVALWGLACSTTAPQVPVENLPPPLAPRREAALTQTQASLRAQQVEAPTYQLWFSLGESKEEVEGRTVLRFRFRPVSGTSELEVDFEGGKIESLRLNGQLTQKFRYDGYRIRIPEGELNEGANLLEVRFFITPSASGSGLIRWKDPQDERVYLYTHLQPAYARRVFPCFDQPDLKASFELTVHTPQDWIVVANNREFLAPRVDGKRSWQFSPSAILPTYAFSLTAGPFSFEKEEATGIPLRFLWRKSQTDWVKPRLEEWKRVTLFGLERLADQLSYPFPYEKYDQILVPELVDLGMENAASTLLSENALRETLHHPSARLDWAELILHELSHSWVGNLVTPKWWDEIWLNESLATSLALNTLKQLPPYAAEVPLRFQRDSLNPLLRDEIEGAGIPILNPVEDTDSASLSFDTRSYEKGAVLLDLLQKKIGKHAYDFALASHLRKFALKNATSKDLIESFSMAAKEDLAPWFQPWLQETGLDAFELRWKCDAGGKLKEVALTPHLRAPRSWASPLTLFYWDPPFRAPHFVEKVSLTNAPLLRSPTSQPCPRLILPNLDDQGLYEIHFGNEELRVALGEAFRIPEPSIRLKIWQIAWNHLLRGKLSAEVYLSETLKHLDREAHPQVTETLLRRAYSSSLNALTAFKILSAQGKPDLTLSFIRKFEALALKKLGLPRLDPDRKHAYQNLLAELTPLGIPSRAYLLSQLDLPHGAPALRWSWIEQLARSKSPKAKAYLSREIHLDRSPEARVRALRAKLALAKETEGPAVLDRWFSQPMSEKEDVLHFAYLELLGQIDFRSEIEKRGDLFFETLPQRALERNPEFISIWIGAMAPGTCSQKWIERAEALLSQRKLPTAAHQALGTWLRGERLCQKAAQASSNTTGQ